MNTHNGFVLNYNGPVFPATTSNQITYAGFCFMGGLANQRLRKISNGIGGFAYHRIDKR